MQVWVGVENFAKIESAKICVDNYTILVGENNSGKTFLMQLVQGISKKLAYLVDETIMENLLENEDRAFRKYIINSENISVLVEHINSKLILEKESIVKEIFGKEIPIEKLYVDILIEDDISYSLLMLDSSMEIDTENKDSYHKELEKIAVDFIVGKLNKGIVCMVGAENAKGEVLKPISLHGSIRNDEFGIFKNALNAIIGCDSLFLPASRTGLLLLYREYFANKKDDEISFTIKNDKVIKNEENSANLTRPVYEFLRFLQTYTESEEIRKRYNKELLFFEEHLIEGHINVNKQEGFSYSSRNENDRVPMYLASSMINEVAPLVLSITSQNAYDRLIIDEVEASLHPQKQLELVRFFNRLNNKGMKLIISTHSDTFVSKLNNLYVLSEMVKKNGEDILKQFNLEKEDLISTDNLFVYEVVNKENGKSIVKEIKGDRKAGYQFDLFAHSAIHIYEEAVKLGEIK